MKPCSSERFPTPTSRALRLWAATILVNIGNQFVPIGDLVPPEETPGQQQPMEPQAPAPQAPAQAPNLNQKDESSLQTATGRTSQGDEAPDGSKPLTDADKTAIVRMIVNASQEAKIAKAMGILKEQGLGENEVKISLEK